MRFFAAAQHDKGERSMTLVADSSFFTRCADNALCWNPWVNPALVFHRDQLGSPTLPGTHLTRSLMFRNSRGSKGPWNPCLATFSYKAKIFAHSRIYQLLTIP